MRKQLKQLVDEKVLLTGKLERYGLKNEYIGGKSITLCLTNIELKSKDGQIEILDHAWLKVGKTLAQKNIPEGSLLQMNCFIKSYLKGHVGFNHELGQFMDNRTLDYGIQRASKIELVERGEGKTFHGFYQEVRAKDFISNKYKEIAL